MNGYSFYYSSKPFLVPPYTIFIHPSAYGFTYFSTCQKLGNWNPRVHYRVPTNPPELSCGSEESRSHTYTLLL